MQPSPAAMGATRGPRSFAEATAVDEVDEGCFAAHIAPEWGFRGKPNGGYLMALAARAALAATGRAHPQAVTGSFVRTPNDGPAVIRVETLKSGRQVTHVRAVVHQQGEAVLDSLIVLGDRPEVRAVWTGVPDPLPAPFDECVPVPRKPGRVGLLERLDIRYDPAASPARGQTAPSAAGRRAEARIRAWVGFADGSAPDALAALLAADVLPASVQNIGRPGWAPSVQMSTYVRALPGPGPLAVCVAGRLLDDRWFDEVADVYDVNGVLVAQGRQLALVAVGG
ncbi:thioesterase family protein [Streptomyces sp. NPDC048527]|uniref:thioesterase family protein n=1 Tax=Streptomyces sp. NPDC048527 TaxID=3365568 RepID=UPI00370FEDA1